MQNYDNSDKNTIFEEKTSKITPFSTVLNRQTIKRLAAEAGFDCCGIAPCRHLTDNERWFRDWLRQGCHASLGYLERNIEKRFDPRRLVAGARTAVVCAVSYKNRFSEGYPAGWPAKIASYACNRDYHDTIRAMLQQLLAALRALHPTLEGRAFVDTAPLAEKQLAVEAGLGWIGRQSLLITPQYGSFVLLGELLLCDACDAYDAPLEGVGCGSCRACMEHCPTGALVAPCCIDTRRCIARHTVERETADPAARPSLHGWIFGCDACQSCCPHNRQSPQHRNPAFDPLVDPLDWPPERWQQLTEARFTELFGTTPLTRSGLQRIRRNIEDNTPST